MKRALALSAFAAAASALALASPAGAATCPAFGLASDCNFIITVNPDGSISTSIGPETMPYDGSEDQLVGVVNNGPGPLLSLAIAGSFIFGFDSDGIQTFGSPAPPGGVDTSGYAGPDNFFTILDVDHGLVNFLGGGLASGATTYFSLEEPASADLIVTPGGVPEPAAWAMMLLGFGGIGIAIRRSRKLQAAKALA